MELEIATIHDIADELANRGSQFIIAIEVLSNKSPRKIHLCVDGEKDRVEVAKSLKCFFE